MSLCVQLCHGHKVCKTALPASSRARGIATPAHDASPRETSLQPHLHLPDASRAAASMSRSWCIDTAQSTPFNTTDESLRETSLQSCPCPWSCLPVVWVALLVWRTWQARCSLVALGWVRGAASDSASDSKGLIVTTQTATTLIDQLSRAWIGMGQR